MDPWTNRPPPQLSSQHSFISLPTFNNADFDYYVLEPDHLREVNDVEQHSHLSPTVHHRVNEQEWILPERRSINYYLSDSFYDNDDSLGVDGELQSVSAISLKPEETFDYDRESFLLEECNHDFVDYDSFCFYENCNNGQLKSLNDKKTTDGITDGFHGVILKENLQGSSTDVRLIDKSKSSRRLKLSPCNRWTLNEKQEIISIAKQLASKGELNVADIAQQYSERHPRRRFDSAFKYANKLVQQGIITNQKVHDLKKNVRQWTDEENELLREIIKNNRFQTSTMIAKEFFKRNKSKSRSLSAISHRISKLRNE